MCLSTHWHPHPVFTSHISHSIRIPIPIPLAISYIPFICVARNCKCIILHHLVLSQSSHRRLISISADAQAWSHSLARKSQVAIAFGQSQSMRIGRRISHIAYCILHMHVACRMSHSDTQSHDVIPYCIYFVVTHGIAIAIPLSWLVLSQKSSQLSPG